MLEGFEDRIRIRIAAQAGRVAQVEVLSTRKVRACRILEGRELSDAVECVPRLFSVCGTAQLLAARTACEQAVGYVPDPGVPARRRVRLLAETLREHCRTVMVDWSALLGETPQVVDFIAVQQALQDLQRHPMQESAREATLQPAVTKLRKAVYEPLVLEALPLADEDRLRAWAGAGRSPAARLFRWVLETGIADFGRSDVEVLPVFGPSDLSAVLSADEDGEFVARPSWQGRVYETGPLARMRHYPLVAELFERYGNGLLTRLAARLVELLELPERIMAELPSLPDTLQDMEPSALDMANGTGVGLAVVEAARGRLVHRVEAVAGKVARYQILAPTEWNFHPDGALVRGLLGARVEDAAIFRRHASLLVAALDPCVGYEVTVQ